MDDAWSRTPSTWVPVADAVTIRSLAAGDAAACERILRALPEWFGIEESLAQYVRDLAWAETWVAGTGSAVAGFLALRPHGTDSSEIHVMAVAPEHHGRGIGAALVRHAERVLERRGVAFLQVKTLGPSRPDEHYARTRGFYERMGFRALEENRLWGPANPCLVMVKHLACPAGRREGA